MSEYIITVAQAVLGVASMNQDDAAIVAFVSTPRYVIVSAGHAVRCNCRLKPTAGCTRGTSHMAFTPRISTLILCTSTQCSALASHRTAGWHCEHVQHYHSRIVQRGSRGALHQDTAMCTGWRCAATQRSTDCKPGRVCCERSGCIGARRVFTCVAGRWASCKHAWPS